MSENPSVIELALDVKILTERILAAIAKCKPYEAAYLKGVVKECATEVRAHGSDARG